MNSTYIYINFSNGRADFNHTSLILNNWNHFVIVFDSSGFNNFGSVVCYFNGIQQTTTYWNGSNTHLLGMKGQTTAFGTITIGINITNGVYFDGELKYLRVYNRIKTQNYPQKC